MKFYLCCGWPGESSLIVLRCLRSVFFSKFAKFKLQFFFLFYLVHLKLEPLGFKRVLKFYTETIRYAYSLHAAQLDLVITSRFSHSNAVKCNVF